MERHGTLVVFHYILYVFHLQLNGDDLRNP